MRQELRLDAAIDADTFSRLIDSFAPLSDKVAIAVSGGPDSMALAYCMRHYGHNAVALIVDHGLRPESADEAAQVKTRLQQMGMDTEILRWEHGPVTGRVHEKARAARYRLLIDACRRLGAGDLLLAHHQDDQAETILMRVAKGSGIDGIAGIAAQTMRDDIRLLRPFLSVPKTALIATCSVAQIETVSDPSNGSEAYARGRLRRMMPLLAAEGLSIERLIDLGARAAESAAALDHYAGEFLRGNAHLESGGVIRIKRAVFAAQPRATAARALSLCLRYIHADDYPPERASIAALIDDIGGGVETIRSFYGCLISIGAASIRIMREPAAVSEQLPISPGQTLLWDERWLVTLAADAPYQGILRRLGNAPHRLIDRLAPALRHTVPQGRARATLPALWVGDDLVMIPSFDSGSSFHLAYRKQSFP